MIGQARVSALVPAGCNGSWGQVVDALFGFTVYTLDGILFTLRQVDAVIQHDDNTITTERVWTVAIGFDAAWGGGGSLWATPVMVMDRVAALADGDTVRFTVQARDNFGKDSYMSWITGVGNPPGSSAMPVVGGTVKVPGGQLCEVESIEGAVGSKRYVCAPNDRTKCGKLHLVASQLKAVGPRDNLDAAISATE